MLYGTTITFLLVNIVTALAAFSSFGAVPGQSVSLAWTASGSGTIAGYHLYYGGASQTYTNTLDVGNATSTTVSDLVVGATYYFAVTAYDVVGLESPFSSEISYTVPGLAKLGLTVLGLGQMQLSGQGPAGYGYAIESSTDLQNWAGIGSVIMSVNGTFQFLYSTAATNMLNFYRLRQTSP